MDKAEHTPMSIKQRGDVIPGVKLREPFILLFLNTFYNNLTETQRTPMYSSVFFRRHHIPRYNSHTIPVQNTLRGLQGAVPYKEQLNLSWHILGKRLKALQKWDASGGPITRRHNETQL